METLMSLAQSESFWVAISTVLCFGFIFAKARAPIAQALDARAHSIEVRLAEAAELHEEAKRLLEEYKQKSLNAETEAETVIRNAERRAAKLREEMEAELRETILRQETNAKLRIKRLEQEAVETVKQAMIDAALKQVHARLQNQKNDNLSDANASLDRIASIIPKTVH